MPHSFDEKLERASYHLQSLGSEIDQWIETRPYTVTDNLDTDTGDNVVRTKLLGSPPSVISQIVGDCLHNLRASLDHLAYALALANKPRLTGTEMTETAFPIFKCEAGFRGRGEGKIKHLSPNAQAIIKSLQPYHAGNNATSHLLWFLDKLENIDKHRKLLIIVGVYGGAGTTTPRDTRMEFFEPGRFRTLKGETEIARYRAVNINDGSRMQVNFQPTFVIAFGDRPTKGSYVAIVLNLIHDHIVKIVLPPLRGLIR